VHIAPSGFISGGDPVAIMPSHNLKEVACILVGALVLVCSVTEIGTFSCLDDASNHTFCCSSLFVGEEVHYNSAADRINLRSYFICVELQNSSKHNVPSSNESM
jgi:hypothetical protein